MPYPFMSYIFEMNVRLVGKDTFTLVLSNLAQ